MEIRASAKTRLALSMAIFGSIGIFVRAIALPSSVIALARGGIGALALFALALASGRRITYDAIKKNGVTLIASGIFLGANWVALFEAYRHTSVATATLCYYLAPVFVMLASPFVLKESLSARKALCAAAALGGVVLISGVLQAGGTKASELTGVFFGIGAATLYASIIFLNKKMKDIPPQDMAIVQLAVASAVILPYTLTAGGIPALSTSTVLLLLLVGTVHTGLAYALYFSTMKHLKAQTLAMFSYIDPIAAILLSALFLGERIGLLDAIGAALILGAAFASDRPNKRHP